MLPQYGVYLIMHTAYLLCAMTAAGVAFMAPRPRLKTSSGLPASNAASEPMLLASRLLALTMLFGAGLLLYAPPHPDTRFFPAVSWWLLLPVLSSCLFFCCDIPQQNGNFLRRTLAFLLLLGAILFFSWHMATSIPQAVPMTDAALTLQPQLSVFLARIAHLLLGSLVTGTLFSALVATFAIRRLEKAQESPAKLFPETARMRAHFTRCLRLLPLQAVTGVWVWYSLPWEQQRLFLGGDWRATSLVGLALFFSLITFLAARRHKGTVAASAYIGIIFCMAALHLILRPHAFACATSSPHMFPFTAPPFFANGFIKYLTIPTAIITGLLLWGSIHIFVTRKNVPTLPPVLITADQYEDILLETALHTPPPPEDTPSPESGDTTQKGDPS